MKYETATQWIDTRNVSFSIESFIASGDCVGMILVGEFYYSGEIGKEKTEQAMNVE